MKEEMKRMAHEILDSANPTLSNEKLSELELNLLDDLALAIIIRELNTFDTRLTRSAFKVSSDGRKAIMGYAETLLFPHSPSKQYQAKNLLNNLLARWTTFIKSSESLKLFRDSAVALSKELGQN